MYKNLKYMDDREFRLNVIKILYLAFVPVEYLTFAIEELRKTVPFEKFQSILDYFEDSYITAWRGNRRVKPNFDIDS